MTAFEILQEVSTALEATHLKYWVGGSIASSIWGDPRQTNDIDLVVFIDGLDPAALVASLPGDYYVSQGEIEEAIESRDTYASFQILHMVEAFKFDVFVVRRNEYTQSEFERAQVIEVTPGIKAPIASAENIVIQKLRWFEVGNRVSDRQWNDIVKVIETQLGKLDLAYLNTWAEHFGIKELLQEAFDQALD